MLNLMEDIAQEDQFKRSTLTAQDRYKLQRREERLRAKGVSLPFLIEERKIRVSSKRKKTSNSNNNRANNSNNLFIKSVVAKTENQQDTIEAYLDGYNLLLHGVAGTGKTFLSLYCGLKDVLEGRYNKLIIIRSVVPSRDMGFLPGTVKEKAMVYESPYYSICSELFGRGDAYEILKQKGMIEFVTTSHIRGITLHDAVVVVDEIQNMNFAELDTVITRVGNCRVIFSGDLEQTDLNKPNDQTGLPNFIDILENIWDEDKPEYSFYSVEFGPDDIVRGGLVKAYIKTKSNLNLNRF